MGAGTATAAIPLSVTLRDALALTKPRLSSLVLATTGLGIWLAPGHLGAARVLLTLVATALAVAAANTLNQYFERDVDARMRRTRDRPLPARRLSSRFAVLQGIGLAVIALPALAIGVNPLAGALASGALLVYVFIYTPLKRRTPLALLIGTVPGAMPPLIGWTAVTGAIEGAAVCLFGIVLVWQLPHFLAVTLYLKDDLERARLPVMPLAYGETATKILMVVGAVLLVAMSLALIPAGVGGAGTSAGALVLGVGLVAWSISGFWARRDSRWARRFFLGTLGYLTLLIATILVDVSLVA